MRTIIDQPYPHATSTTSEMNEHFASSPEYTKWIMRVRLRNGRTARCNTILSSLHMVHGPNSLILRHGSRSPYHNTSILSIFQTFPHTLFDPDDGAIYRAKPWLGVAGVKVESHPCKLHLLSRARMGVPNRYIQKLHSTDFAMTYATKLEICRTRSSLVPSPAVF